MPKKQTTVKKTVKKKSPARNKATTVSSGKLKGYNRLSPRKLAVLAAAFIAVGIATLVYGFAATPTQTIEAESFTFNRNQSDITKPGSTTATIWFNAEGSKTVNFERKTTQISVNAYAGLCDGAALMEVKVDGIQVMLKEVKSASMTTYSTDTAFSAGQHEISIGFLNDYYKPNVCDRNLFVDNIILTGETVLDPSSSTDGVVINSVAASKMTYGNAGYTTPTGGVIARSGVEAQSAFTLASETNTIVANVYAQMCDGAPEMVIKIDDAVVLTGKIDNTTAKDYTVKKTLAAGNHTIKVALTNDFSNKSCDRNLRLNKFDFRGKAVPPVLPKPPVTSNKLKWAPPAGWEKYTVVTVPEFGDFYKTLDDNTDYQVVFPKDRVKHGGVSLTGGRNIVIMGGEAVNDSVDFYGGSIRALFIVDGPKAVDGRIVHIEGFKYSGSINGTTPVLKTDGLAASAPRAILQVQNTTWLNMRGQSTAFAKDAAGRIYTSDGKGYMDSKITVLGDAVYKERIKSGAIKFWKNEHSDMIQPFGGVKALRVDRMTGSTNGQSLFLRPDSGSSASKNQMGSIDLSNVNLTAQAPGAELLWFTNTNSADLYCQSGSPIKLSNVYLDPGTTGKSLNDLVWPKSNKPDTAKCPGILSDANKSITWPALNATGKVQFGKPSTDYVPSTLAGFKYQSPGYIN